MTHLKPILLLLAFSISSTTNASVIKVLNGIEYEWLELTATAGLSRDEVELILNDSNDVLHGYQYASRSLVEDLYLSYSSFDGLSGRHSSQEVINGGIAFLNDFGHTVEQANTLGFYTVEGDLIESTGPDVPGSIKFVYGIYGLEGECRGSVNSDFTFTCNTHWSVYYAPDGTAVASWQSLSQGWDADSALYSPEYYNIGRPHTGSLLVRQTAVPVPATIWLFGSGFMALICIARRRKNINLFKS